MTTARNLTLFVLAVTAGFVYICRVIPQIQSVPVAAETTIGGSPEELAGAGREIFMSDRAQCLTCHSLGEDPKARCPNQEGLGERAPQRVPGLSGAAYLVESLYNPNAFVVPGYPRNQMTPVNRPPIALSHDEILAVLAFLNTLGAETTADFIDELRKMQEPWRQGLRRPEDPTDRAALPIFPGDSDRGHAVFQQQGCDRCHRVGPEGPEVGPDLTAIGASQSAGYLLEAIIDPSAVIVKGYMNTIVIWKEEGRLAERGTPMDWRPNKERPRVLRLSVLEGNDPQERAIDLAEVAQVGDTRVGVTIDGASRLICGEYVSGDAETGVTLRVLESGRWVERRFAPESIEFLRPPVSPMPANYAELMTPRETYDLLAYLVEQKGAP